MFLCINSTSKPIECTWPSSTSEYVKGTGDAFNEEKYDCTVSNMIYVLSSIESE